jgi:hypothetical protein
METEHTETVVDKAVAYVKDILGLPPDATIRRRLVRSRTIPTTRFDRATNIRPLRLGPREGRTGLGR